ncbi:MAG TPA: SCO1664 family protein [Anaerolineales bacterium]|nr:SCO1664 family protein [Anaerolineales bacterium]HRQ92404.1 SCO1664 family protein [Anaerolineales bacterium]
MQTGELTLEGQFTWGSNYTFLVRVGAELEGVYKPVKGEQPLWDFPSETLAGREVAAYLLSEALGWTLVPPTVLRTDGPFGPGSLQLRVAHDPELHYFTFEDAVRQQLRPAAVFDLLANNADRKGGHILLGEDGHLWLIDHGICFHEDTKLRTVIWDFAGEPIPDDLLESVRQLQPKLAAGSPLAEAMAAYLSPAELEALRQRAAALLAQPNFPHPPEDERYMPWPPV